MTSGVRLVTVTVVADGLWKLRVVMTPACRPRRENHLTDQQMWGKGGEEKGYRLTCTCTESTSTEMAIEATVLPNGSFIVACHSRKYKGGMEAKQRLRR